MKRREFLNVSLGAVAAPLVALGVPGTSRDDLVKTKMGIAQFSFNRRQRSERRLKQTPCMGDPLCFLRHCHGLGAGGIQTGLGQRDSAYATELHQYADEHELFIEGSIQLPREPGDMARFESHVQTARACGVKVLRTAMGQRRYEQFETLDQFKAFQVRSWQSLQLAESIVAKNGLYLAIENHKDFRVHQMLTMLERLSSEHVGVCVDTGNSIALLEDPMDVVRAYAPWARAAHLKDLAVCEYEDGFLLADVPLGEGLLDLPEMVRLLKSAYPDIAFSLEMATRDALKVPCLTECYWATFDDVSGADLARILRYVRNHARPALSESQVDSLPPGEQMVLEQKNIITSLRYASSYLDL